MIVDDDLSPPFWKIYVKFFIFISLQAHSSRHLQIHNAPTELGRDNRIASTWYFPWSFRLHRSRFVKNFWVGYYRINDDTACLWNTSILFIPTSPHLAHSKGNISDACGYQDITCIHYPHIHPLQQTTGHISNHIRLSRGHLHSLPVSHPNWSSSPVQRTLPPAYTCPARIMPCHTPTPYLYLVPSHQYLLLILK